MSRAIFVTGATGYLGGAIARQMVERGDTVHGLTHRDAGAEALERAGVHPVVGDMTRPERYLPVLETCDALIHAADDHARGAVEAEPPVFAAFEAAARAGRLKRAVYTSGLWVHGDTGGRVVDESAPLHPLDRVTWRPAHEQRFLALADLGVAAVVVRPAIVYGEARGLVSSMIHEADRDGVVRIPGNGPQRTFDAAAVVEEWKATRRGGQRVA